MSNLPPGCTDRHIDERMGGDVIDKQTVDQCPHCNGSATYWYQVAAPGWGGEIADRTTEIACGDCGYWYDCDEHGDDETKGRVPADG